MYAQLLYMYVCNVICPFIKPGGLHYVCSTYSAALQKNELNELE